MAILKLTLYGFRIAKDPEVKVLENGKTLVSLLMIGDKSVRTKDGAWESLKKADGTNATMLKNVSFVTSNPSYYLESMKKGVIVNMVCDTTIKVGKDKNGAETVYENYYADLSTIGYGKPSTAKAAPAPAPAPKAKAAAVAPAPAPAPKAKAAAVAPAPAPLPPELEENEIPF